MWRSKKIVVSLPVIAVLLFSSLTGVAVSKVKAVHPANGEKNVNVGIIKWVGVPGFQYDLYIGTTSTPTLYKSNVTDGEVKPIAFSLNSTYRWMVVAKKEGKPIDTSAVFTFSTLPISLNPNVKYSSFVDTRDYKIYWTTTIGGKEWMVQNLDYIVDNASFYYDNLIANKVYGQLYLGSVLATKQKDVCPAGWRIPTEQEWDAMLNAFGGSRVAASALKESSERYWRNSKAICSNSSGMSILPAGSRDSKPSYSNLGKYAFYWTSTISKKTPNSYIKFDFGFMRDAVNSSDGDPTWSYSIRCIKE
jgi:uncharacterized protein (TIGR02145 family)